MTTPVNVVIAADLSGRTGWCVGSSLKDVEFGVTPIPEGLEDRPGARWAVIRNLLEDKLNEWRGKDWEGRGEGSIIEIVIERDYPAYQQTNQVSAVQQMSLTAVAQLLAHDEGVGLVPVSPSTVRTFVMGRGNGKISKKEKEGGKIVRWLRPQGWAVWDHNVADAILLWAWRKGLKNVVR